jgi:hypothetical protein
LGNGEWDWDGNWNAPVIGFHGFVEDELVVAFGGEVEGGSDDAEGCEGEECPGGGDEVEACVEVPAVPEV